MSLLPKELLERYQPQTLLGEGGMGRVIQAYEPALDRTVAIKLALRPDPHLLERLRREARTLSEIRHPNLVEVYDFGLAGDQAYLVMEYLDGLPLDEAPVEDAIPAILQVADALEALHARGVVHRDLKPQNVMLTQDGRAVLLDFGLVKPPEVTAMTATGALVGTLPYVPPEVHRGETPGPEADWYALGITLYSLCEGAPPYDNPALFAWATGGELPPLRFQAVPEDGRVARIVRACLATNPAARPRTRRHLEALRDDRVATPSMLAPRPARGKAGRLLAAGLLLFTLGLGLSTLRPRAALPPASPTPPAPAPTAPPLPPGMQELGPNAAGRRQARNLIDGSVMILLPAITIQARGRIAYDSRPAEPGPPRPVHIPDLWFDRYEVTVERYRRFLAATGHRLPEAWEIQLEEPLNPVCFVGVEEGQAYAAWAGGRLPTTDEWERAAAGPDGTRFPWGEAPVTQELAHIGVPEIGAVTRGPRALRVVGSYPSGASPDGLMDLMGNVSEWAAPRPIADRPDEDWAILVGGSLLRRPESVSTWNHRAWPRVQDGVGTGFRIVRDHPGG